MTDLSPTAEDLYQFWESHPELGLFCDEPVKFARAILAQWGSPKVEPVPAAEKPWEQDGWCDAAGCCWFFWPEHVNDNLGDVPVIEPPIWEYRKPEAVELYPFSLPHDAVSLPNSNHD